MFVATPCPGHSPSAHSKVRGSMRMRECDRLPLRAPVAHVLMAGSTPARSAQAATLKARTHSTAQHTDPAARNAVCMGPAAHTRAATPSCPAPRSSAAAMLPCADHACASASAAPQRHHQQPPAAWLVRSCLAPRACSCLASLRQVIDVLGIPGVLVRGAADCGVVRRVLRVDVVLWVVAVQRRAGRVQQGRCRCSGHGRCRRVVCQRGCAERARGNRRRWQRRRSHRQWQCSRTCSTADGLLKGTGVFILSCGRGVCAAQACKRDACPWSAARARQRGGSHAAVQPCSRQQAPTHDRHSGEHPAQYTQHQHQPQRPSAPAAAICRRRRRRRPSPGMPRGSCRTARAACSSCVAPRRRGQTGSCRGTRRCRSRRPR